MIKGVGSLTNQDHNQKRDEEVKWNPTVGSGTEHKSTRSHIFHIIILEYMISDNQTLV